MHGVAAEVGGTHGVRQPVTRNARTVAEIRRVRIWFFAFKNGNGVILLKCPYDFKSSTKSPKAKIAASAAKAG
jgi:hypothetical protein